MMDCLPEWIAQHPYLSTISGTTLLGLIAIGVKSYLRRPRKINQQGGSFFTQECLLSPPMSRPAYSDRMAYLLAEMSALAYFQFEESGDGAIQQAVEKFTALSADPDSVAEESLREVLTAFQNELFVKSINSKDILSEILNRVDFELLDTININDTQGFVCKRVKSGEAPYLVVAFRGTEMAVNDWLTDMHATPTSELPEEIKVHNGFWDALHKPATIGDADNVISQIRQLLDQYGQDKDNQSLPCYFTGHSLGGALALITTRELAPDISGACYTFGAPRVANYEYFKNIKTPVFRVVNSADIVPRVPPGAGMAAFAKAIQGINWLTQNTVGGTLPFMNWLEEKADKLKHYRHHGDQRYLTDVKAGRFQDVRLITNPPMIDRLIWMGQHMRHNVFVPVKSHGMAIYRKKLSYLAHSRNPQSTNL